MRSVIFAAVSIMALAGCQERKPSFSADAFEVAKRECGAKDAYIIADTSNTIGFRGTADEHVEQAKCIKQKLAGTDVQTVVLGSAMYGPQEGPEAGKGSNAVR
ncbi:hypothetical protein TPR58_16310 [Sphingomonas sp. HF-S3]|jgi:hypothetical protein|uniref:DUF4156 domain-containing protein n=1 Tax=Sphingomonas rustica TaxID=3103142 RepID=A0ABV0BC02_9SPHN